MIPNLAHRFQEPLGDRRWLRARGWWLAIAQDGNLWGRKTRITAVTDLVILARSEDPEIP